MFDNDKKHGQKTLGAANVDIREKLSILADAAKYDASCASSGTNRKSAGSIGSVAQCGICHSFAGDGRCISLLKVLGSRTHPPPLFPNGNMYFSVRLWLEGPIAPRGRPVTHPSAYSMESP